MNDAFSIREDFSFLFCLGRHSLNLTGFLVLQICAWECGGISWHFAHDVFWEVAFTWEQSHHRCGCGGILQRALRDSACVQSEVAQESREKELTSRERKWKEMKLCLHPWEPHYVVLCSFSKVSVVLVQPTTDTNEKKNHLVQGLWCQFLNYWWLFIVVVVIFL